MLRLNNAHCQSIIHLCHHRTINTIALPPLTVGAPGTQRYKHTKHDARTHMAQRSGREVIIGSEGIKSAPCCLFIIAC